MEWVKQPTREYRQPEVLALTDAAEIMHHRGRAYAGDMETHGFIPEGALPMLMRGWTPAKGRAAARALVAANLWEQVDGGWKITGWGTEQSSMEAILTRRREKDAARQARHRERRRQRGELPGPVRDLRAALAKAGLDVAWHVLDVDRLTEVAALLDQHGPERLVDAAKRAWQPNDPARYATAFLPIWRDLDTAPARPRPVDWCGHCDEHDRRITNDDGRLAPCPTCHPYRKEAL